MGSDARTASTNASRGEEIRMGGTGRMSVYASEVERGGGGGGRREVRCCPGGAGRVGLYRGKMRSNK